MIRLTKLTAVALEQWLCTADPMPHRAPGPWGEGHIQFIDARLQYRPGLPEALAGISFEIRPGQKVGICGRTGICAHAT